jgi:intracellular sulfur oxidation DsrE/DsrF family protein
MNRDSVVLSERRSFLTRLNTGLASLVTMAGVAMAQQRQSPAAHWEPARHEKDDWLDKPSVKHRLLFDTTEAEGLGSALAFADNFCKTNKAGYGVQGSELAVVIVVRHHSAGFGFNDEMWRKYGATLAARAKVADPKTKQAPTANFYNSTAYGELIPNRGITLESLAQLGVQFAVCTLSTRANAGLIASAVGSTTDAIFTELSSNLVSNARLVPAGIVTVSRAQERGYTFVSC